MARPRTVYPGHRPLAVTAARVNCVLAIADRLPHRRREVEIPVYLADSILAPARGKDLFAQNRRILETMEYFMVEKIRALAFRQEYWAVLEGRQRTMSVLQLLQRLSPSPEEIPETLRAVLAPARHFLVDWRDYWLQVPEATHLVLGSQRITPEHGAWFRLRFENTLGLTVIQPFAGKRPLAPPIHLLVLSPKLDTPAAYWAFFQTLVTDLYRRAIQLPFHYSAPTGIGVREAKFGALCPESPQARASRPPAPAGPCAGGGWRCACPPPRGCRTPAPPPGRRRAAASS